jgi:hypothetical protein
VKHVEDLEKLTLLSCQIRRRSNVHIACCNSLRRPCVARDTHDDIALVKIFAEVGERCICNKT